MQFKSIFLAFALLACCPMAHAADLGVTVEKIHPGPGNIRVALYATPSSFRHEDQARQVATAPANAEQTVIWFKNIPPGRYAVLAYHDANNNKKLDLRLGMFPIEGWGLSNDPVVFGPPRFSASAFDVAEKGANIVVLLHY